MTMNYYLYFHRRLDTNEIFYVGIGDKTCSKFPYQRAFSFRVRDRNPIWCNIFYKCDKGISVEIIEEFESSEECKIREQYWIKKFGKLKDKTGNLANITDGGDKFYKEAVEVIQYNLDGSFVRKWNSVNDISQTLKIESKAIYQCLEKNSSLSSSGGFMWRWSKKDNYEKILPYRNIRTERQRSIKAINIKNNKIRLFESVSSAAKELKVDTSTIFKCLKGERKQSKGYKFEEQNNQ